MISSIEEPGTAIQFPFPCPGYRPGNKISANKRYQSFLAVRTTDDQRVILDFILADFTPPIEEHWELEARAQKILGLQHPGIFRLSKLEQPDENCVLVHEEAPMQTLPAFVAEHGCPPLEDAVDMLTSLADALAYAWRRKSLAHQELGPDQVMMDQDHQPRIRDLGIADLFPGSSSRGRIDVRKDMRGLVSVFRVLTNTTTGPLPESLAPHVAEILTRMESPETHRRPAEWEDVCARLRTPASEPGRKNEASKEWHPTQYRPQKGFRLPKTLPGRLAFTGSIALVTLLAVGILNSADYKKNRQARTQLNEAIAFKSASPEKHNDLIDRLNRILARGIKDPIRQQVADELADAEAVRSRVNYQILSVLDREAAQHIELNDFGAAAHTYHAYDGPQLVESRPHRERRVRLLERMTSQPTRGGAAVKPDQDPNQLLNDILGVRPEQAASLADTMRMEMAQRARAWQYQYEGLLKFIGASSPYDPDLVSKAGRDLEAYQAARVLPRRAPDNPDMLNSIHDWGRIKRDEMQRQVIALSRYYAKNGPVPGELDPTSLE